MKGSGGLRMSHRAQCLVLNGLQVLLVHYIQGEHDYWGLPGGPLNENEPPERAAQRHLEDACGLRVRQTALTEPHRLRR